MKQFEIEIPVEPMAAPRPRFGKGRTYSPAKYEKWKLAVSMFVAKKFKQPICGEPILLYCCFRLQRPKSAPNRKYPSVRPDLDNYIKALKDSLTGVVWKDDSQICAVVGQKVYLDDPETESHIKITVKDMP